MNKRKEETKNEEEKWTEEEILRKFYRRFFPDLRQKIDNLITSFHELQAKREIGPRRLRIGVFGSYPEGGKDIIIEIAKNISKLGFAAITGMGYFLPNRSEELLEISRISPPVVRDFFTIDEIPLYWYYRLFPRLVNKAIVNMSMLGGQIPELEGCFEEKIPTLGFIITEEISRGIADCAYLSKNQIHTECLVPSHVKCLGIAPRRPFCPFYDSVNISWLYKQLFIRRKENRLVAVKRLKSLGLILKDFLSGP